MEAAFLFHALKAGVALVGIIIHQGPTRMPIAYGGIAQIKKWMIGQIVAHQIVINVFGVPGQNRQDFV